MIFINKNYIVFSLTLILSQGFDSFTGGIIKVRGRDDCQTRFLDDLLSVVNICSFQANNKRDLQLNRLAGVNDSISDGGAVDNPTKHVDQDGLHLVVLGDDAEGLLDLVFLHTAADIQEVGRLPPVQLDDVHGGHGQPGSVDEAANVPVQLDVVQRVLGGLPLPGI